MVEQNQVLFPTETVHLTFVMFNVIYMFWVLTHFCTIFKQAINTRCVRVCAWVK